MVIGVCTLELAILESDSLKDKRQVIKSLIDRIHHRFNVSVSEVDHQDIWRRAGLGIACVTIDQQFASTLINKVVALVESDTRVEVTHCAVEML